MKKKLYLRKKRKNITKISIIIIFVLIGTINIITYLNKIITPRITNYAELEVKKITKIIINKAVQKHITEEINIEDLFMVTKNENNEIVTIDYNSIILNKLLTDITSSLGMTLKNLEEGKIEDPLLHDDINIDKEKQKKNGFVVEISTSQIFDNFLFSNLGPKIPIRLKFHGDIESNISSKVTNYGINNVLIEVYLNIKLNERVILPISTKTIELETKIPISMKIIQGTVPKYYGNSIDKPSTNFLLPVE